MFNFFNRKKFIFILFVIHGGLIIPLMGNDNSNNAEFKETIKKQGGVVLELPLESDNKQERDLSKYSFGEKYSRFLHHTSCAGFGALLCDMGLNYILEMILSGKMLKNFDERIETFIAVKCVITIVAAVCFSGITQKAFMQDAEMKKFQDYMYNKPIGDPYDMLEPATTTVKTFWGQIAIAELFSLIVQYAYHYLSQEGKKNGLDVMALEEGLLGAHVFLMTVNLLANIPLWMQPTKLQKNKLLEELQNSIEKQLREQNKSFLLTIK